MELKTIVDEDFVNYKKPSMFIFTTTCDGKCWREQKLSPTVCQNHLWRSSPDLEIKDDEIITRYINNPITSAIIFGGFEPLLQAKEVVSFVRRLRKKYHRSDTVIIYTGYYPDEVYKVLKRLARYDNIIVKFGRYIPSAPSVKDKVLGIWLASDNQFARQVDKKYIREIRKGKRNANNRKPQ